MMMYVCHCFSCFGLSESHSSLIGSSRISEAVFLELGSPFSFLLPLPPFADLAESAVFEFSLFFSS
jgi:hypothetical protein